MKDELQRRSLSAIMSNAFFSWPSAVLIGFSIVAFFLFPNLFNWWQPWYWIVFGVVAELIYLGVTLTDPAASQEAVRQMLLEKYDPRDIKNLSARQRLEKAMEYKRSIDAYVARQTGATRVDLEQTATLINGMIGLIYRLAQSIDTFESNEIVNRDRRNVPAEIENLKRRMSVESDPSIKAELQNALQIRQTLQENLKGIENATKRSDIKLDTTLAQLSTFYAQMQLQDSKSMDSGRTRRLQQDIQEEIASLADTISVMDEVYQTGGYRTAVATLAADSSQSSTPETEQQQQTARRSK